MEAANASVLPTSDWQTKLAPQVCLPPGLTSTRCPPIMLLSAIGQTRHKPGQDAPCLIPALNFPRAGQLLNSPLFGACWEDPVSPKPGPQTSNCSLCCTTITHTLVESNYRRPAQ